MNKYFKKFKVYQEVINTMVNMMRDRDMMRAWPPMFVSKGTVLPTGSLTPGKIFPLEKLITIIHGDQVDGISRHKFGYRFYNYWPGYRSQIKMTVDENAARKLYKKYGWKYPEPSRKAGTKT